MGPRDERRRLTVTAIGGPTVVLELAGLRLITDPTFDPPGAYEPRPGVHLTKTAGPAIAETDLAPLDVVLLSHDHHKDNLDDAGRRLLERVPWILTTPSGADRLGSCATPLANWQSIEVTAPGGGQLKITGVPARHGPEGSERLVGDVTGFLVTGDGYPTVYVSGDNASLDVVGSIAERVGAIDVAVLFAGGARMPYLPNDYLTLPSAWAPAAAQILGAPAVLGIHLDGWSHFTDDRESLIRAFEEAHLAHLLRVPRPGETVTV